MQKKTTKENWKIFKFQDWNQPLRFGWSYERCRVAAIPRAPETLAWKGSASTVSVASIHHWICHVATIPTCTIWRAGGRETAVGKTRSWFLLAFVRSYLLLGMRFSPFQGNVHIPTTMLASLAFTRLSILLRHRFKSTMFWQDRSYNRVIEACLLKIEIHRHMHTDRRKHHSAPSSSDAYELFTKAPPKACPKNTISDLLYSNCRFDAEDTLKPFQVYNYEGTLPYNRILECTIPYSLPRLFQHISFGYQKSLPPMASRRMASLSPSLKRFPTKCQGT